METRTIGLEGLQAAEDGSVQEAVEISLENLKK